jgi:eukaryotic-like serine/threonine-protein kinase
LDDDLESRARARVGNVLDDKWTLERLLGVGGMAAVYAARHRNAARAAVKLLHPDFARHKEVRERFCREGYAANRVEHPGTVKVLDDGVVASGPDAGNAYIVMELLDGESMQDRLERGPPMGEAEFLEIADGVLDVLHAAHTRSVVHRDLKPENLFLLRPEAVAGGVRVKVLDFGLARLLDGQAITTYGLALGTPSFMSPEQASGRIDEIDGRTDLFALAATGFRLRTGRRIHEAPNAIELVRKMASLAAPRIRSVSPDVSEPYARVIDRALEFRREHRYGDAAAMKEDVQRALAELDAGVAPTRLALPPTPPPEDSSEREPTTLAINDRGRAEPSTSASSSASASEAQPAPKAARQRRSIWRRSILPWVAVLFFGAIGTRLWLDAHPDAVAFPPFPTSSAIPSTSEASGAGWASSSAAAMPEGTAASASSEPAGADAAAAEVALPPHPPAVPAPVPVAPASVHPSAPRSTTTPKPLPTNVHKEPPPKKHHVQGTTAPRSG